MTYLQPIYLTFLPRINLKSKGQTSITRSGPIRTELLFFRYSFLRRPIPILCVSQPSSFFLRSFRCSGEQSSESIFLHPSYIYSYWFFLLYFSINSSCFLNLSTLSSFNVPAFSIFLCCLSQLSRSCSSIRCFDGFRLFISIKFFTLLYFTIHFSSCVIGMLICQPPTSSHTPGALSLRRWNGALFYVRWRLPR